jgi:hypothetical protein
MGISPKTETRCDNFSFFGRQDLQKRDFRKTRNCASAFQFLGKCPYPISAPRALKRSLSVGLRYRFSVPALTAYTYYGRTCRCVLRVGAFVCSAVSTLSASWCRVGDNHQTYRNMIADSSRNVLRYSQVRIFADFR